jgi:hypothetical protein
LDQLAAGRGARLTAQDREDILEESLAGGFTADATEDAFGWIVDGDDDHVDDDDVEDEEPPANGGRDLVADVASDTRDLERDIGRKLTGTELKAIAEGAIKQAARHDRINVKEALEDFYVERREDPPDITTSDGRSRFFKQRMQDLAPEPVVPDRQLDMTVREDRHEYLKARVQGVDFDDAPDATPDTKESE